MIINIKDIYLAAAGGLLIGIATSIHYLLKGRVTGFSGIFYSLITFDKNSFYWKLSLMSSVVLSSSLLFKFYGFQPLIQGASPSFDDIMTISKIGYYGAALAGLLVGFGTKLGNGCNDDTFKCFKYFIFMVLFMKYFYLKIYNGIILVILFIINNDYLYFTDFLNLILMFFHLYLILNNRYFFFYLLLFLI